MCIAAADTSVMSSVTLVRTGDGCPRLESTDGRTNDHTHNRQDATYRYVRFGMYASKAARLFVKSPLASQAQESKTIKTAAAREQASDRVAHQTVMRDGMSACDCRTLLSVHRVRTNADEHYVQRLERVDRLGDVLDLEARDLVA